MAFSDELSEKDARDLSDKRKKDREEEKRILNNLGLVSDTDPAPDTIPENAKAGTPVGITAFAMDGDAGDSVSYSGAFPFKIDANTGVVVVDQPLDREAAASHTITVTASSSGGAISRKDFVVTVEDVNEFDVNAVTTTSDKWVKKSETSRNYQRISLDDDHEVSEGDAVGSTVVLTAVAEDRDATNNTVRYSLSDTAGGLFAIDPATGEVRTARALDYETAKSHSIVVVATSADGSSASRKTSIVVLNANDGPVGPVADVDPAPNAVMEHSPAATPVGITLKAIDPDTGDKITYGHSQCWRCTRYYDIDPETGVVTTSGSFQTWVDLEWWNWSNSSEARRRNTEAGRLSVVATSSDGSTSELHLEIDILDANENAIDPVTDANAEIDRVAENAAPGTPVGITVIARDRDARATVSYRLGRRDAGLFKIDPATGIITLAGALDFETARSHSVTVVATSSDGSTSQADFTINLADVSEFSISAVTDLDPAPETVPEGDWGMVSLRPVGITAFASDADAGATVSYSLKGGRMMDKHSFGMEGQSYIDHVSIDVNTGVVSARSGPDFETSPSFSFTIVATSDDGSTSEADFTLTVTNVNEYKVADLKDADPSADEVLENAQIGTSAGITALAIDHDTGDRISYSLKDSSNGMFAIDPASGLVTVAGNLDAEKSERHYLTVMAASTDGSTIEKNFLVLITDANEFDVAWKTYGRAPTVREDAAMGEAVDLGARAHDPDPADTVTYALANGADVPFAVDPASGEVSVSGSLRDGASASYTLEIVATSSDGSQATTQITVSVQGINDFQIGALTDSDSAPNEVYEDAAAGIMVGITALAEDQDWSDAVTYALSGNGGPFSIDPQTGVITVSNYARLDAETRPVETVTVEASSSDGSRTAMDFEVSVLGVNEHLVGRPFDIDDAPNEVAENAPVGTPVGITAFAEDLDVGDTVTYRMGDYDDGLFAIDPDTGVVTVIGEIDYETRGTVSISVLAVSSDGAEPENSFAAPVSNFEIRILPVNEFDISAFEDTDPAPNQIDEFARQWDPVGITVLATDGDADGEPMRYALSDQAGAETYGRGPFNIDPRTGQVTVDDEVQLAGLPAGDAWLDVLAISHDGSTRFEALQIALIRQPKWWENPQGPRREDEYADVAPADREACVAADEDRTNAAYNNEAAFFDCMDAVKPRYWSDNPQDPRGLDETAYVGVSDYDWNACAEADKDRASATFNTESAFYDCLDAAKPGFINWYDAPQDERGVDTSRYGPVSETDWQACKAINEDPSSRFFNDETEFYNCLDRFLDAAQPDLSDATGSDDLADTGQAAPQGDSFQQQVNTCAASFGNYYEPPESGTAILTITNASAEQIDIYEVMDPSQAAFAPDPVPLASIAPGTTVEIETALRQASYAAITSSGSCLGAMTARESRSSATFGN